MARPHAALVGRFPLMSAQRQALGRWGERQAAAYLQAQGYAILAHNARTAYGEIDLVARLETDAQTSAGKPPAPLVVFVEVKTRSSRAYGLPEEAITAQKQAHMLASAQAYLQEHPELVGDWRIDVIAVQRYSGGQAPQITHFENAIR
jgi:putative endonuclease